MEVVLSKPNLALVVSPRREVPCPVIVFRVRVGEHIVVFRRPCDLLCLDSVDVLVDRRVLDLHFEMTIVLIEVADKCVSARKVVEGISICKVLAPWNEHIVCPIVFLHVKRIVDHLGSLFVGVEGCKGLVVNNGDGVPLEITLVVTQAIWEPVHVLQYVSEDLHRVSKRFIEWLPNELHGFVSKALFPIFVV